MGIGDHIEIRTAERSEVPVFIDRAAGEGWNPGIYDGYCHYAVDPEGWFVATIGDEIAGTLVLTNYDDSFSFGGFFIVREDLRHTGTGWKLWNTAIAHVGERNLGGDGVYEMQTKYEAKDGFRFAYRNIRWEGTATGSQQKNLTDIREMKFSEVLDYDSTHFPAVRESFLREWIRIPESAGLAYTGTGGQIEGYGVIRKCINGHKIGQLFADTPAIAEKILDGLTHSVRGETFYIDTPEINHQAVAMVLSRGMTEVFGTARMYTGEIPEIPVEEIFGVTTFELG